MFLFKKKNICKKNYKKNIIYEKKMGAIFFSLNLYKFNSI